MPAVLGSRAKAARYCCVCWQEELFIKFAEFEEKCKEPERARAIYKYALDHIPKGQAQDVYKKFVAFEKQHGDREGIEVITSLCTNWLSHM